MEPSLNRSAEFVNTSTIPQLNGGSSGYFIFREVIQITAADNRATITPSFRMNASSESEKLDHQWGRRNPSKAQRDRVQPRFRNSPVSPGRNEERYL